ncbi:hypothetical protein AB1484_18730 [Parafrankia sp. FMc6]|uniref:hypothetical protein n=1 Tax=Parafrankia soli TaxID=2599596 RepID=UPI0034D7786D
MQGMPDLGHPLLGGPGGHDPIGTAAAPGAPGTDTAQAPWGDLFEGYADSGCVVVLPAGLELEHDAEGVGSFLLTLTRFAAQGTVSARLDLVLRLRADLDRAAAVLGRTSRPGRLRVGEPAGGLFVVCAPRDLPEPLRFTEPTVLPDGAFTGTRLSLALIPQAAPLVQRVMAEVALPVRAAALVRFRTVAPRLPAEFVLDPRELAEYLLGGLGAAPVDRPALVRAVGAGVLAVAARSGAGLGPLGDNQPGHHQPGDAEPGGQAPGGGAFEVGLLAEVLALRLAERVAAPSLDDAGRERWSVRPPERVPSGHLTLDLAEPAVAALWRPLTFDPLVDNGPPGAGGTGPAAGTGPPRHVRHIEVPALPAGHRPVRVAVNLPRDIEGLLSLVVDVDAGVRPSPGPVSAVIDQRSWEATIDLPVPADEPLHAQLRLRAVTAVRDTVVESSGPPVAVTSDLVIVTSEAFPTALVTVSARAGLLRAAVVAVLDLAGDRLAALSAQRATSTIPLDDLDAPLTLVVTPLGAGSPVTLVVRGQRRVDLDESTLPGFGTHPLALRAQLFPGERPVLVQLLPDGDGVPDAPASGSPAPAGTGRPQELLLTEDQPSAATTWLATSPFRPGVRWRSAFVGSTPGAWSEPVSPGPDLLLDVTPER